MAALSQLSYGPRLPSQSSFELVHGAHPGLDSFQGQAPAGRLSLQRSRTADALRLALRVRHLSVLTQLRRSGRGLDRHRGHVPPELLECVVVARLGSEDVQHRVEVVADDPGALARA